MYGHISESGLVGELFDKMPPEGVYHEKFLAAIKKLPRGVGSGWRRDGKKWIDPATELRERTAGAVRAERRRRLDHCDLADCNAANWELMDGEEKARWHIYKQLLRDVPEQAGFPFEIEWPR